MKILFFGTPRFSEIVLQSILDASHEVVGVVCQTDKPAGRGNKMVSPHIVSFAKERGLPVFQFEKLSAHLEDFKKIDCDVAVTASYGKYLPAKLFDILNVVNVHPSMLPKYRGGTPIQSALLNGDTETGVSIMKTGVGMDDGDIYVQETVSIEPEDDYFSLHDKLAEVGSRLLLETLDKIERGKAVLVPQDAARATFVKLIQKEDALLDFSKSAAEVVNKVRAFCESPVAFILVGGERIKVYKAKVASDETSMAAGEIIPNKKHFLVQAKDGVVKILRCQAPGGKALDASAFLNGYHFKAMRVDA